MSRDSVNPDDRTQIGPPEDDSSTGPSSPTGTAGSASTASPDAPTQIGEAVGADVTATDGAPPPDATRNLTGHLLLNRYRIGEPVGTGGFGTVYRAIDELKQQAGEPAEIAIKVISAVGLGDRLPLLVQEVTRSHQVTHPNILRVYDIHVDGAFAFITMEILHGRSLSEHLDAAGRRPDGSPGPLPIEDVDRIARAVCEALDHCHENQLVHADIKPGNIFVCSDGTVKVLDLGIAQVIGGRGRYAGYSRSYASPQQMSGELADPRDDVFALGCVLYKCLTSQPAFAGRTSLEASSEGCTVDTQHLPARYRRAVQGALELRRESRTASPGEVWRSIDPAARRRRALMIAAGVAVLLGIGGALWIGRTAGQEDIAVSEAAQAESERLYDEALDLGPRDPGLAREKLVQAIIANPYNEDAGESFVELAGAVTPASAAQFSLAWADLAIVLAEAPNLEPVLDFAHERIDAILSRDYAGYRRSRVLSELRAPLCVLRSVGHRSSELEELRAALNIGC